ncbi:MAG: sigma-54-dependent Fis family transcriptional regulator [Bacillota bacterium]
MAASQLMEVREFAQVVTDAIASVVGVEVGMVDEHLLTVAGSGRYAQHIGRVLGSSSVSARVLAEGRTLVIADPPHDVLCEGCSQKTTCTDAADVISPLVINGETAGCVLLVACTPEQKDVLIGQTQRWVDFLEKMSDLISRAFSEQQKTEAIAALARQYDTVLNSVQEGILALDTHGTILQANQAAARLLQLPPNGFAGRPIIDIFPGLNEELLKTTETTEFETFVGTRREKTYWLGRVSPIAGEGVLQGYVLTFRGMEEIPRMVATYMRERPFTFDDILGTSSLLTEAKRVASSIARGDATVLIQGESGTGKELFARAIHYESPRRKGSFVAVNCAAIPEAILESELFGYEEGAFTGAKRGGKPGKFELAQDGTLFLDEIGDMPLHLQVKLLRALEERQVDRLGGRKPVPVNIRVVAATNKDLRQMAMAGQFRLDLYYRLAVIPISIPPLREHKEDIPEYVTHHIRKYAADLGKAVEGVEPQAMEAIMRYDWPGNIRELANALEYAVNLVRGPMINLDCLPRQVTMSESGALSAGSDRPVGGIAAPLPRYRSKRQAITREVLETALREFGDSTRAKEAIAEHLGMSRASLYRKLKEHGL